MSKQCAITGRTAGKGWRYSFLRSHYNPTAKRRFEINLQTITAIIDGVKQKMKVSTKAIKTYPELKSGMSSAQFKKGSRRKLNALRNKQLKAAV